MRLFLLTAAGCLAAGGCSITYVVHDRPQQDSAVIYDSPAAPPAEENPQAAPVYQPESGAVENAPANADSPVEDANAGVILADGDAVPGDEYVRVEITLLGDDLAVPGCWRLRQRPGYIWVEGRWLDDGYLPGYWQPVRTRGREWAWVPGYWDGHRWFPGRWRPRARSGWIWAEGHWSRGGEWIAGCWRPLSANRPGWDWESGFWDPQGRWVDGFWRPASRENALWIGGMYNENGIWVRGYWQTIPHGQAWVKGYWDPRGGWIPGRLTELPGNGERILSGHYNRFGKWMAPNAAAENSEISHYREHREGMEGKPRQTEAQQIEAYREKRGKPAPQPINSSASQADPAGSRGVSGEARELKAVRGRAMREPQPQASEGAEHGLHLGAQGGHVQTRIEPARQSPSVRPGKIRSTHSLEPADRDPGNAQKARGHASVAAPSGKSEPMQENKISGVRAEEARPEKGKQDDEDEQKALQKMRGRGKSDK